MAGERCSWEAAYGNPAKARLAAAKALKIAPDKSGCRGRSGACVCHGGRYSTSRVLGPRLRKTLPAGHADAVALAARDSGTIVAGQKEPGCRIECVASCFNHRVREHRVRPQYFLPLSRIRTRRGILGSRTGQCCRRRVSEDPRPQRHRLELLDGSVGASGSGSRQRLAGENFTGQGQADADAARVRALAAYKDFLTLWKDADPDIPILKQAKAEYAKLLGNV